MVEPLKLGLLVEYRLDSLPFGNLRLILNLAPSDQPIEVGTTLESVPVGMSAAQARLLGQALLDAANHAEARANRKPN